MALSDTLESYRAAITRIEDFVVNISSVELNLPSFAQTLEAQLKICYDIYMKYENEQKVVIAGATDEADKRNEEMDLARFSTRCKHLATSLEKLIASTPFVSSPHETKYKAQPTEELRDFMTAMLKQSDERHQKQMDILLHKLNQTASTEQSSNIQSQNSQLFVHNRLPQLNLPNFDGNYASWISFKNRFQSNVINYPHIANSQRLEYLQSVVTGSAASAIKHLSITDDNFAVAWKILTDKFERENDIISGHVRSFYAMPKLTPSNPEAVLEITDILNESTTALEALKATESDHWIIQYTLDSLDNEARILWGRERGSKRSTLSQFKAFMDQRCIDYKNSLQSIPKQSTSKPNQSRNHNRSTTFRKSGNALATSASPDTCKCCNETAHPLYKCPKFLAQKVDDRFQTVKRLSLCRNCFATHMTHSCTFHKCQKCQGKHNVLLHDKFVSATEVRTSSSSSAQNSTTSPSAAITPPDANPVLAVNTPKENFSMQSLPQVFLPTAIANIFSTSGESIPCRVVLDGAATVNIMTSDLYEKINLPQFASSITISGVSGHRERSRFYVNATIGSQISGTTFTFKCYVMPKINGDIPDRSMKPSNLKLPSNIHYADPQWYQARPVDLLLCGNPYWACWLNSTIELGPGMPLLKETVFGYVVVGEHEPLPPPDDVDHCALNVVSLEDCLTRFFEAEDVPGEESITEEQMAAEHHFTTTYTRDEEGRFVVRLPFKEDGRTLGDSRPLAVRQLLSLERKFERNPALRSLYCEVMNEQLKNKWIEPVPANAPAAPAYYMPHHGVLKDSTTTKLRIVFNASAKTTSGYSLNDILRTGPTIQPSLCIILFLFRRHPYATTADISKMYLQVKLHPDDANFQRFLWRESKSQPIQELLVNRVCFGGTASPFLAIRPLFQLAHEHQHSHPLASNALKTSFYVDDCILSSPSLETALKTRKELTEVLQSAGFPLAKWSGNHPELRQSPSDPTPSSTVQFGDPMSKALGLQWNTDEDFFKFACPIPLDEECDTKRKIASAIARLFDPLGLIGPVIIEAKILLQDSHKLKIGWDSKLPEAFMDKWRHFVDHIQSVDQLSIPRWISNILNPSRMEVHVFTDASLGALGSVVYIVTSDSNGNICSRLLTTKSRVAPIKAQTVPRLELCGAVIGAQLGEAVCQAYHPDAAFYWCDSTTVLYWINNIAENYKIFIANRLKKIHTTTQPSQWRHVSTHYNPADIISRGSTPLQLKDSDLWWFGPTWLSEPSGKWPQEFNPRVSEIDDLPAHALALAITSHSEKPPSFLEKLYTKYSGLGKLQRIIVYCLRLGRLSMASREEIDKNCTTVELEKALNCLIYLDQTENLPGLREHLQTSGTIKNSKYRHLASLTPFVDAHGLIRVGGRLQNSDEPFFVKHPILLPESTLSNRIIEREHMRLVHAGPTLLLASLRQRYWPVGGRNYTRKICHWCMRCRRAKPRPLDQLMGNLPEARVKFTYAFHRTGVDYAGPIMYRPTVPRGAAQRRIGQLKGYIAVFVCMVTKNVHLEFVTSLSTEAFIAAFRRFSSLKNTPRHMHSDCGKNFEGAARELKRLHQEEQLQRGITENTQDEGIIWHFNPPRAPHFGGLWEACVKNVKSHLNRVLQHTSLSFEEMGTVLAQIAATLNSRPIGLISNDPNDPVYLTPGHLFSGRPNKALPDPNLCEIPQNRLSIWQFCQQRAQEFAEKFRLFYLNTLQQRAKWRMNQPNLVTGEVVLFLDESQAGSKWRLGQVEEVRKGRDNRVRVILIRTPSGIYKRPITKISRLPVGDVDQLSSDQSDDQPEEPGEHVQTTAVGL